MLELKDVPQGSLLTQIEQEAYEHAIFLTYSLDVPYFDSAILRHLVRKGCSNIAIFADARYVAAELLRMSEPGFASRPCATGKYYSLTPIHHTTAFHPKVTILVGEKVDLFVGSGNLEPGGMQSNIEIFHRLEVERENPSDAAVHAVMAQAWHYVSRRVAKNIPAFVKQQLEQLEEAVPWFQGSKQQTGAIHFVSSPGSKVVEELLARIDRDEVHSLYVISPFFDSKLVALDELVHRLKPRRTILLLQSETVSFPGNQIHKMHNLEVYDLGQANQRYAHAKVVIAECRHRSVLFAGSHNVTSPAFDGHNFEAGIIRVATDGSRYSEELGVATAVKQGRPLDLANHRLKSRQDRPDAGFDGQDLLVAAELDGNRIDVVTRKQLNETWRLLPFRTGGMAALLDTIPVVDGMRLRFTLQDPSTTVTWVAVAVTRQGFKSVPVPLLHVQDLLEKAASNSRLRLASRIRGGFPELSAVERLLRDFQSLLLSSPPARKLTKGGSQRTGASAPEPEDEVKQLTYQDFVIPWQRTVPAGYQNGSQYHDLDMVIRAIASSLACLIHKPRNCNAE